MSSESVAAEIGTEEIIAAADKIMVVKAMAKTGRMLLLFSISWT